MSPPQLERRNMSTAVASIAPPLAPPRPQHDTSPKPSYPTLAPSSQSAPSERRSPASATASAPVVINETAAQQKISPDGKRSPHSYVDTWRAVTMLLQMKRHANHYTIYSGRQTHPPKIIVKKEPPSSPEVPSTSRHRPRKLDLTSSTPQSQGASTSRPSAPLTATQSASLGMHDVGLACLSPGFQTQDPNMREQLQRSISVRDQQRHIIESRLQQTAKPSDSAGERPSDHSNPFGSGLKTPMTSSKKKPPPGLSIVPPSHQQFANERVIQSAPLHQSFPGRHQPHPLTRQVANQPSNLSNTSHIHHVPAHQTHNRLPPIADVFAGEGLGINRDGGSSNNNSSSRNGYFNSNPNSHSSHSNQRPPFPSPGLQPPPSQQLPLSNRPREYRSAEEAVAEMAGGRVELLPKIVHYGGHQPPTPPSPTSGHNTTPNKASHGQHQSGEQVARMSSGRRRHRAEYEHDMGTPPLGSGPEPRRGPFGEGPDSPETNQRKKEEFLSLCSRAWELFHS